MPALSRTSLRPVAAAFISWAVGWASIRADFGRSVDSSESWSWVRIVNPSPVVTPHGPTPGAKTGRDNGRPEVPPRVPDRAGGVRSPDSAAFRLLGRLTYTLGPSMPLPEQHRSIPEDATVPVPLIIMSTADPVLRDAAMFSVLTDLPGTGVLRQDLDPVSGTIRRVISDDSGIAEDHTVPLAHSCLGCAIREDSLPALESMVHSGRWQRIVWALPVTADTAPAARPLANPEIAGRVGIQLCGVASVVAIDTLTSDLMNDELLADRGLGLWRDDRRAVGESMAAQIAHADLVLTTGSDARGAVLVDHLRGPAAPAGTCSTSRRRSSSSLDMCIALPNRESTLDSSLRRPHRIPTGCGRWICRATGRSTRGVFWIASPNSVRAEFVHAAGSCWPADRGRSAVGTAPAVNCPSVMPVAGRASRRPPGWCSPVSTMISAASSARSARFC